MELSNIAHPWMVNMLTIYSVFISELSGDEISSNFLKVPFLRCWDMCTLIVHSPNFLISPNIAILNNLPVIIPAHHM